MCDCVWLCVCICMDLFWFQLSPFSLETFYFVVVDNTEAQQINYNMPFRSIKRIENKTKRNILMDLMQLLQGPQSTITKLISRKLTIRRYIGTWVYWTADRPTDRPTHEPIYWNSMILLEAIRWKEATHSEKERKKTLHIKCT